MEDPLKRGRRFAQLGSLHHHQSNYLQTQGNKVFIIHGHDGGKLGILTGQIHELGFETIVLKEIARTGRTLIDRFLFYANESFCTVCLMTPDDIVVKNESRYAQARPNVLFELGWFYGRFGPDKLCLVHSGNPVIPSDLGGVMTLELDTIRTDGLCEVLAQMKANANSERFRIMIQEFTLVKKAYDLHESAKSLD